MDSSSKISSLEEEADKLDMAFKSAPEEKIDLRSSKVAIDSEKAADKTALPVERELTLASSLQVLGGFILLFNSYFLSKSN